jgi:hypothetical protein
MMFEWTCLWPSKASPVERVGLTLGEDPDHRRDVTRGDFRVERRRVGAGALLRGAADAVQAVYDGISPRRVRRVPRRRVDAEAHHALLAGLKRSTVVTVARTLVVAVKIPADHAQIEQHRRRARRTWCAIR